jgi:hypothetical protein
MRNSAQEIAAAAPLGQAETPVVDAQQPWLGLASFTEETRSYFFGREDEIAELARRVQRKLLTVLFGQSGLGKTSILRAGVVPRLRSQGYCPVYVRIDYGPEAPAPSEQIKQAIFRTAQGAGQWSQPGVAVPDESPWEFLHHRDDILHDASGAPLIPLLIFDQFEEVFTLAQSDDAGRRRAARFLEDLADLVENRPPQALEKRFEQDDAWAERFDFSRSDYRVLIALREDYLAHLEGLKGGMPSVTQNRMRLAPMTGEQALAAVTGPGGALVTPEVAGAIVRFVAGGAELRNAEVEPSLLSLICRELNDARVAAGRAEISLDLLEGTRATILSEFYERALADQPAAVRQVIEDKLLTDSGYRENVAEERLLRDFAAAGAAPGTLALLVNRRLLRIEERLDVRRVELTHDVLCEVVRASRDLRQERDSRAATERQLAQQRERELAARRALVRARQVATVCIVLAVGAIGASIYAYASSRRAQEAEQQARIARGQAENLIGYLMDDLATELEPVGKRSVLSDLDGQVVRYYRALPDALKGPESERSRALAMVAYAKALVRQSKLTEADPTITEAIALLEKLQAAGDRSEETAIGLARGLIVKADVNSQELDGEVRPLVDRAVQLLQPLAAPADASAAVRLAYGEVLFEQGYFDHDKGDDTAAAAREEQAMRVLATVGGRDLSNPTAAATYARAAGWRLAALTDLEQDAAARAVAADGIAVASGLLDRQPGHLVALYARALLYDFMGHLETDEGKLAGGLEYSLKSESDWRMLTRLDPSNQVAWNNLGAALAGNAGTLESLGQMHKATVEYLASTQAIRDAGRTNAFSLRNEMFGNVRSARLKAELGDANGAAQDLAQAEQFRAAALHDASFHGALPYDVECFFDIGRLAVALTQEHYEIARDRGATVGAAADERARKGDTSFGPALCTYFGWYMKGEAEYHLGDYAAAEASARSALAAKRLSRQSETEFRRMHANGQVLLAKSLARQKKDVEARQTIEPLVEFLRKQAATGKEDQEVRLDLAQALYAQALADVDRRPALLHEASALIAGFPGDMQAMHVVADLRKRIAAAVHA